MSGNGSFAWQDRDREILSTLTHKVRLFTLPQIARTWWPPSKAGVENARKRLGVLRHQGLLNMVWVQSRPELVLEAPVFSWSPGEPGPNSEAISYRLRSRWKESVRDTAVFTASVVATKLLGGSTRGRRSGGLKRPLQATHDIHLSGVYLTLLKRSREFAARWVSEESLAPPRPGEKVPDAMLFDECGSPSAIIEFGGSYRADRVERIHQDCAQRGLPYELW